ncbi:putative mitochondrial adenine nucleotide transporter BTL1 [Hibiscus syriacus]|uniref:Mitochondrial adenine nucleotide transporter BTL1 n=1 Tax=Hibiscus syriacus TaxID=106335 RepID=A0A6A2ZAX9_HIBSY|nr:putative mitochondrial adenine nucleotide transporter BTL1 [Hibiscus syriacus]
MVVVVPKELDELEKPISLHSSKPFEIRFQIPDLRATIRDFLRSREVGEFLSGALAGAMTKAVLAPLETIRTRMVVGVGSKNIIGSFVEITDQQGWQGLWAGNGINMIRIIPTQAIELATFECVKRAMTSAQEKWSEIESPQLQIGSLNVNFSLSWISPTAVAGAAAGIASTLACHPLEVLKDRLTVSPDTYPSLSIAISKIYKDGGVGALYAGFTASTISFPLEVARKRLMVGALQGKCPPNMVAALAEVIRDEGLTGLYRGWGASCLKVMPSSGITWMFYEAWKDVLLVERRIL